MWEFYLIQKKRKEADGYKVIRKAKKKDIVFAIEVFIDHYLTEDDGWIDAVLADHDLIEIKDIRNKKVIE